MARFTYPNAERKELLAIGKPLSLALEALRSGRIDERASALVDLVRVLRERAIDCAEWSCNEATEAIGVAELSGHQRIAMAATGYGVRNSPVEKLSDAAACVTTALRDLVMGWPDKEIAALSGNLGLALLIAELEAFFNQPFMEGIR